MCKKKKKKKTSQARSKYGGMKGWRLCSFVVKEGDDLKKEKLAMQFIELFQQIWQQHHVEVYVRPYAVQLSGSQCGLLENIVSARSLDSLKKNTGCQDLSQLFLVYEIIAVTTTATSFFIVYCLFFIFIIVGIWLSPSLMSTHIKI
jgi:hypothetical protein